MSDTVRRMLPIRLSPRTLLAFATLFTIALALLIGWWTRPFVLAGTFPNGAIAWQQWERRTLSLNYEHIKTVRFYPSGQKSFEFTDGKKTYWSPEGKEISASRWWGLYTDLPEAIDDPGNEWPSKSFIRWWNEW
jgi:hypothetical protein